MWTCVATQYFACKLPKFVVEIITSMRLDVEFLLDKMWNLHET